ncbi:MAG: hypothetical protein HY592_05895 [Candidatus Omnitrophica bacterium]|nr:hypothetical protein [Candidatus Omnitrophota bacterium]
MRIGESLKKGFSTAQESMSLISVLFLFGLFWNLVNVFYTSQFESPDAQISIVVLVIATVFVLLSVFMQAGSLGFVREKVKTGTASLATFTASGGKYYWTLFVIGLMVSLVIGIFVLLAVLAAAALNQSDIAAVIAAVIISGIGIYIVLLMFLAPYIAVSEDKKAIASIRQSIGVVRKNILRVVGLALLLVVIGFVIGLVLGALFAVLSGAMPGTISQVLFAVLSSFVNSYLGVLVTAAFMSFYLGLTTSTQA